MYTIEQILGSDEIQNEVVAMYKEVRAEIRDSSQAQTAKELNQKSKQQIIELYPALPEIHALGAKYKKNLDRSESADRAHRLIGRLGGAATGIRFSRNGKGNSDMQQALIEPTNEINGNGELSPTTFLTEWFLRRNWKAGDKFTLCPDILARLSGHTPQVWVSLFIKSNVLSSLARAGWKFETSGTYINYTVTVKECPKPIDPRIKELEVLRGRIDQLLREINGG